MFSVQNLSEYFTHVYKEFANNKKISVRKFGMNAKKTIIDISSQKIH